MSGRSRADDRLKRILAFVPWVAERDGPTVEEVCQRFGCSERQLMADIEVLFVCGAYPYTPDQLIEAVVEDGRVWIRYADWFKRPLRLTPAEGLALVASATALLSVPGTDPDGPLAHALAKVASVLGVGPGEGVDVALGAAEPSILATLRHALEQGRAVDLAYYSFGRDETTQRTVDPWDLRSTAGAWYVSGWCHQADEERTFRVDRVRTAELLDQAITVAAPAGGHVPSVFSPRPDDPVVVIDVPAGGRWVASQYPTEAVEERPDGGLRVSLRVSERGWLERLLLRLGADAHVVGPADMTDVGASAATRMLARYR